MMILAVSRRLPQLLELQRERTWQPLEGAELRDVTVGIVGLGSIGRAVGALATAFGCRVVAVRRRSEAGPSRRPPSPTRDRSFGEVMLDRVGGPETLPELLAESDFVVLAAPLTPETEDMINDETLAMMKPGSWLINVARGRLDRRAGAPPGAPRRPDRRGRPRHVPRRAAAADVAVLRPAERHRHAAHVLVERPRPRPQRRAVLRQPPPVRGGRAAPQRRRSRAGVLTVERRPSTFAAIGMDAVDERQFVQWVSRILPATEKIGTFVGRDVLRWQDSSGARVLFERDGGRIMRVLASFDGQDTASLGDVSRMPRGALPLGSAMVLDGAGDGLFVLVADVEQRILLRGSLRIADARVMGLTERFDIFTDEREFERSDASLLFPNETYERDVDEPPLRVGVQSLISSAIFGGGGPRVQATVHGIVLDWERGRMPSRTRHRDGPHPGPGCGHDAVRAGGRRSDVDRGRDGHFGDARHGGFDRSGRNLGPARWRRWLRRPASTLQTSWSR